jgi:hypothetical protein
MTRRPSDMSERDWQQYQAGQRAGALAEAEQRRGLFLTKCEEENTRRGRRLRTANRTTNRAVAVLLVLGLIFCVLGAIFLPMPRASAWEPPCTRVWLTTPSLERVLPTGTERCLDLTDGIYDDQLIRIYRLDNPTLRQIDWIDRWALTTYPTNNGRYEPTADLIRWVANKYDAHVQFGNRDLLGRLGCSTEDGFPNSVTGAYQPSPRHPGEGLVRIGTGFTSRCMEDRHTSVNTFKHELGHVWMERICGTTRPPIAGDRVEWIASAYAMLYFDAEMVAGGLVPTSSDIWRAKQIHSGNCG